jgi:hypothetical protein
MERGFIIDVTHGSVLRAKWVEGVPKISRWWGITNLRKHRKHAIVADRCVKCGFLEQFALEETR